MDGIEDAGLLERARIGHEPSFSQLFARFQRPVFRYAAYMGGPDMADDIVQETFLAVLRQTGRRDRLTGSLTGYLIGIARHLILKRRGRDTEPWIELDEIELDRVAATLPTALTQLVEAESIGAIRAAVRSLPPVYREAIVLCELEEIDYATAATLMACPIGTVRSRLHRARALLAATLTAEASSATRVGER